MVPILRPLKGPEGRVIPTLDPLLQATRIETPVTTWGTIGRTRPMPGTYCFYADDFKFSGLWKDPSKLLLSGCKVVAEVNYSTFADSDPDAVLEGIYRKRTMSAYWQTAGVRVLVDLDVADDYLDDYALLGVPKGWRAYATRSHRESQMDAVEEEYAVAVEHAGTEDILFAVFGGSRKVAAYCAGRPWRHVPESIEVARGRAQPYTDRPAE